MVNYSNAMSKDIKIETVNKISQIYSVDVHCNPLIVDVRLDVEKNVSATSDAMKDEASAKASAYAKAKGAFKIDLIVDPSYAITTSYSNILFAFIAALTFGVLKFGVRYTVTISGYAGYYINPKQYYEHQNSEIVALSNAVEIAFSNTPKLTSKERKFIEKTVLEEIKPEEMSDQELLIWKKYLKIKNKQGQTSVFRSIFYPESDLPEIDYGKTSPSISTLISPNTGKKSISISAFAPIFKAAIVISVIVFAYGAIKKKINVYHQKQEVEKMSLNFEFERLNAFISEVEKGISNPIRGSVDSIRITQIRWNYKPENYSDSVKKYDEIREKLLKIYSTEYLPKVIENETAELKKKFFDDLNSYVGLYTGSFGENEITLRINVINNSLEVVGNSIVKVYNEMGDIIENSRPFKGKVFLTENEVKFVLEEPGDNPNDGIFTFIHNTYKIEGEWNPNNKNFMSKVFALYKTEEVENFNYN